MGEAPGTFAGSTTLPSSALPPGLIVKYWRRCAPRRRWHRWRTRPQVNIKSSVNVESTNIFGLLQHHQFFCNTVEQVAKSVSIAEERDLTRNMNLSTAVFLKSTTGAQYLAAKSWEPNLPQSSACRIVSDLFSLVSLIAKELGYRATQSSTGVIEITVSARPPSSARSAIFHCAPNGMSRPAHVT